MGVMKIVKEQTCNNCPCCNRPQQDEGFQQIIELKDNGFSIYWHFGGKEDATRTEEYDNIRSKYVFIIHNTKNKHLSSQDLLLQLDKNEISCTRCRQILEHVQKLLNKVPFIDKKNVIGVCDHCRLKGRIQEPCHKCDKVIKKFVASYNAQKEDPREHIKMWLSKIEHLLSKTQQKAKILSNPYSEKDLNHLLHKGLSKSTRDFKAEMMFHSKTCLSETDLTKKKKHVNEKQKFKQSLESIHILGKLRSYGSLTHSSKNFERQNSYEKMVKGKESLTQSEDDIFIETTKSQTGKFVNVEQKSYKIEKSEQIDVDLREKRKKSKDEYQKSEKIQQRDKTIENHSPIKVTATKKYKAEPGKPDMSYPDIATAKENKKRHTISKLNDDLPRTQIRVKQEKEDPSKKKHDVFMKLKPLKDTNETQTIKVNEKHNKRQREEVIATGDSFKETGAPDKGIGHRFKEKDPLASIKQKSKSVDKDHQNKDATDSFNRKGIPMKESVNDSSKDKKSKQKKSDLCPLNEKEKLSPIHEKPQAEGKATQNKEQTAQDLASLEAFKKLKAELAKNKEELKKNKQAEIELQKVKDSASKNVKGDPHKKTFREAKANIKSEPERPVTKTKKTAEPKELELKMTQVKLRKPSTDNVLLQLVKVKQKDHVTNTPRKFTDPPVDPLIIKLHKSHSKGKTSMCVICNDSDLEVAVENYEYALHCKPGEIIIGERITKNKPALTFKETKETGASPMLFRSQYIDETPLLPMSIENINEETKNKNKIDPELSKGIIRYALSDRTFIDKGWTMLPTEKVVRKMNVYRMRPAHPEFDWFEHNKNKRLMHYETGEKLADFNDNGRGRWYYKNGRVALDYYDAEETNAQQRFVVYSSGEPDERGRSHPITILATFDYLGNGIVFDHAGKIRLKYNQTEGVVLDRSLGPVSHWKWHTLNDPPVLQQVMIDTQMAHKDLAILQMGGPQDTKTRPDNEEMLAIEFDNFIKEKSKKLSQKFKPFQIKMKALKINEHFSLRVLDQATIYLIFRDGSTNLKLNIGMVLDHQEIVDTDTAELGEVSNSLERFPARTDSLAGLQSSVAHAQRYERIRTERERRLHPSEPCVSADRLISALSRPLRPPMRTVPTVSTSSTTCGKINRKSVNNLYYSTRII